MRAKSVHMTSSHILVVQWLWTEPYFPNIYLNAIEKRLTYIRLFIFCALWSDSCVCSVFALIWRWEKWSSAVWLAIANQASVQTMGFVVRMCRQASKMLKMWCHESRLLRTIKITKFSERYLLSIWACLIKREASNK